MYVSLKMEPCPGLRVIRGPDWCMEDQDGGEGCLGTVVKVNAKEGAKSALVQWDLGTKAWYRCGKEDKFDLRVFDTAPTSTGEICNARILMSDQPDAVYSILDGNRTSSGAN